MSSAFHHDHLGHLFLGREVSFSLWKFAIEVLGLGCLTGRLEAACPQGAPARPRPTLQACQACISPYLCSSALGLSHVRPVYQLQADQAWAFTCTPAFDTLA